MISTRVRRLVVQGFPSICVKDLGAQVRGGSGAIVAVLASIGARGLQAKIVLTATDQHFGGVRLWGRVKFLVSGLHHLTSAHSIQ